MLLVYKSRETDAELSFMDSKGAYPRIVGILKGRGSIVCIPKSIYALLVLGFAI